jgi:hypothetical protein
MKAALLKFFGEDNGTDLCIAKIMACIAFLSFLGYSLWGLRQGHYAVDAFANGLMQVLCGSAAVIAGKNITTRQP